MIRIRDIKIPAGSGSGAILDETAKILCLDMIYPGNSYPDLSYEVLRRSIDARKKPDIYLVYTVRLLAGAETEEQILKFLHANSKIPRIKKSLTRIITDPVTEYSLPECGRKVLSKRPVVVGMGPAGMFAALLLARRGFCPLVIEQGENVDARTVTVRKMWNGEKTDPYSNVQFGEGGAGTFSDGKLNTLTKDTNGRNSFVLKTFYEHGAPKEITTDAKPHMGTDVLTHVVRSMREEIISLGAEVLFNTRLTGFSDNNGSISSVTLTDTVSGKNQKVDTDVCILCIGHSARDTFQMLYDSGITMKQKSFAAGFRVIHPQAAVNNWQYGPVDPGKIGLPPADYKVTNETGSGRRVYSFCMCPGGFVVNASSEADRLCVNGMSEHDRAGEYANSAVIVAVTPDDFMQDEVEKDHPLAGMHYQRRLEEEAYSRGNGSIPAQYFTDFESGRSDTDDEHAFPFEKAVRGSAVFTDLRGIFSDDIDEAVIESMHKFGYTMKDFDKDALMLGVESRTSSPVRIERDEDYMSNIKGLYPCGEGAGYAGGITSAAADGIRVAEAVIKRYRFERTPANV